MVSHLEKSSDWASTESEELKSERSSQWGPCFSPFSMGHLLLNKDNFTLTGTECSCCKDPILWMWLVEYEFHKMKLLQSFESNLLPCVKLVRLLRLHRLHLLLFLLSTPWSLQLGHHQSSGRLLWLRASLLPPNDLVHYQLHRRSVISEREWHQSTLSFFSLSLSLPMSYK